jgi:GNAT superfamily N-acetyltransferase
MPLDVHIRPMLDSELPLVADNWSRSFITAAPSDIVRVRPTTTGGSVAGWAWYAAHRAFVKSLLEDIDTEVLVATPPGLDEAVGWAAFTRPGKHALVMHYAYVLRDFRRHGVFTALHTAVRSLADGREPKWSHMTDDGRAALTALEKAA